jgi:hypothetical protein
MIRIQIGKKYWDLEMFRKSYKRKILVSFAKAIILHRKIQVRNMRYIQITITFIVCALELLHKDNMSCLIYFLHYLVHTFIKFK